jgi:hypothetical protein
MQRVTQGGQEQRLRSQGIVVQSVSTREQSTQTNLGHAYRQRSSHSQALLEVRKHYTCRVLTPGTSVRCRQPKGPGTGAHLLHARSTHAGRGAPVLGSVSGANDKTLTARGRGDCSTSKETSCHRGRRASHRCQHSRKSAQVHSVVREVQSHQRQKRWAMISSELPCSPAAPQPQINKAKNRELLAHLQTA